jgi:hypothetical protein
VVPVDDDATTPFMVDLHDALRRGLTLAEGLQAARARAGDGPLATATACSFVAFGPG